MCIEDVCVCVVVYTAKEKQSLLMLARKQTNVLAMYILHQRFSIFLSLLLSLLIVWSVCLLQSRIALRQLVFEGDLNPSQVFDKYRKDQEVAWWITWTVRVAFFALLSGLITFTFKLLDKLTVSFLLVSVFDSYTLQQPLEMHT